MKEEIRQKLVDAMAGPLSEPVVTYILVKVRELLDLKRRGLAETDPVVKTINELKAYCDWTMHVDMTYGNRTRPFLTAIDNYLQKHNVGEDPNANPYKKEMQALYYLDDFRSKLENFLADEQLPNDITKGAGRWVEFLKHYAAIIHNRSMKYQGNELVEVRQMTFTTLAPSAGAGTIISDERGNPIHLPFGIQVNIEKKDGEIVSLTLPDWTLK